MVTATYWGSNGPWTTIQVFFRRNRFYALAKLVQKPRSSLKDLDLIGNDRGGTFKVTAVFAAALATDTKLC